MFAKIQYSSTYTLANLVADIVAVLTGTTNIASLSTPVDKQVSYVNTTVNVAGWEAYDTATSLTVLRAPISDIPGKYKYLAMDTSSGVLGFTLFENWNTTTHTGTNAACDAGYERKGAPIALGSAASGDTYFVSASSKHVVVSATLQTSSKVSGPVIIAERTRNSLWDTVANAYPAAAQIFMPFYFDSRGVLGTTNTTYYGYAGATRNYNLYRGAFECSTNEGTSQPIGIKIGKISLPEFNVYNSNFISVSTSQSAITAYLSSNFQKTADENKVPVFSVMPIETYSITGGNFGGSISSRSDIWAINLTYGVSEDEIDFNGNRYVLLDIGSGTDTLVRFANLKIMVRKG